VNFRNLRYALRKANSKGAYIAHFGIVNFLFSIMFPGYTIICLIAQGGIPALFNSRAGA